MSTSHPWEQPQHQPGSSAVPPIGSEQPQEDHMQTLPQSIPGQQSYQMAVLPPMPNQTKVAPGQILPGSSQPATEAPQQMYQFVDSQGQPRPVRISKSKTWYPKIGTTCQVDGCTNVAYNKCDSCFTLRLCTIFSTKWYGCERFHCIHHTFFRPNIHSKPVYRCRDKECNNLFYGILRQWQNIRCLLTTAGCYFMFILFNYIVMQSHNNNLPNWLLWVDVILFFFCPFYIRDMLKKPYRSNRRQDDDDGMTDIYIMEQEGYFDYNCYDDGLDISVFAGGSYGGGFGFGDEGGGGFGFGDGGGGDWGDDGGGDGGGFWGDDDGGGDDGGDGGGD